MVPDPIDDHQGGQIVTKDSILDRISRGRTDLVFDLLRLPDWRDTLREGPVRVLQWFVYYNDVTALKAVSSRRRSLEPRLERGARERRVFRALEGV